MSLQDENARLRTEARRDSKRIEQLTGEVRMLTRAAAAVVVAARSCQVTLGTAAEGLSGMSVGSLVGSVRLGSSVSISSGSVRSAVLSVGSMGRSVGSTVGSASFMGSTDQMRFAGSSVGLVGSSAGSYVVSLARSSTGSSAGSSAGSYMGLIKLTEIAANMVLEDCHDAGRILESPSADVVLGPIVFPRLVDDTLGLRGSGDDEGKSVVRVLELPHPANLVSSLLAFSRNDGGNNDVGMEWHPFDPDGKAPALIRVQSGRGCPGRSSRRPTRGRSGGWAGRRAGTVSGTGASRGGVGRG